MVTIIAISDTHCALPDLPSGDLLIHCGDFTFLGKPKEVESNLQWLKEQSSKFKKMIGVPGNHDFGFTSETFQPYMQLLLGEKVEWNGLKIFGTPMVPRYGDWAFMASETYLEDVYNDIPEGLDIFICHGPAYGILDKNKSGDCCGSKSLYRRLTTMSCPPKVVLFGHIHRDLNSPVNSVHYNGTSFYNVSYMNESYDPVNGITTIVM